MSKFQRIFEITKNLLPVTKTELYGFVSVIYITKISFCLDSIRRSVRESEDHLNSIEKTTERILREANKY